MTLYFFLFPADPADNASAMEKVERCAARDDAKCVIFTVVQGIDSMSAFVELQKQSVQNGPARTLC